MSNVFLCLIEKVWCSFLCRNQKIRGPIFTYQPLRKGTRFPCLSILQDVSPEHARLNPSPTACPILTICPEKVKVNCPTMFRLLGDQAILKENRLTVLNLTLNCQTVLSLQWKRQTFLWLKLNRQVRSLNWISVAREWASLKLLKSAVKNPVGKQAKAVGRKTFLAITGYGRLAQKQVASAYRILHWSCLLFTPRRQQRGRKRRLTNFSVLVRDLCLELFWDSFIWYKSFFFDGD